MAILNPPTWLQQSAYPAIRDRQTFASLFEFGGVKNTFSYIVKQTATPSMELIVTSGTAFIFGTSVLLQGVYTVINDADVVIKLQDSNNLNPRYDLIVLRVHDVEVTGNRNEAEIEIITGSASSSPVVPALPESSIELARVYVGKSVTSVTNSNIDSSKKPHAIFNSDLRGSPRVVTSTSRPIVNRYIGMEIIETDTQLKRWWDGSRWNSSNPSTDAGSVLWTNEYRDSRTQMPLRVWREGLLVHAEGSFENAVSFGAWLRNVGYHVGTLPAAYRPSKEVIRPAGYHVSFVGFEFGLFRVDVDGKVRWQPSTNINNISYSPGQFTFTVNRISWPLA